MTLPDNKKIEKIYNKVQYISKCNNAVCKISRLYSVFWLDLPILMLCNFGIVGRPRNRDQINITLTIGTQSIDSQTAIKILCVTFEDI